MNYLEEQTDGEAMINYIKNGEHLFPVVAQVSLARTAPNAPPTLKDPKFWTAKQKKTQKIDRLARSLLIQRLPNDIYFLIDSNDIAKYRDCAKRTDGCTVLYTYLPIRRKTVVATSDPLALVAEKTKVSKHREKVVVQSESEGSDDEYISDLKEITMLLEKAFNQKKYYAKPTNNNLTTSSVSSSANKKPKYVKSEEKKEDKKADEKKWDMSKVKCYNCKKEGHFAKDCKKAKVKDYNYYKTKMFLAKKDSDEQVLLAKDQAWTESSKESSSSAEETIVGVSYYSFDSESESEYETSEYYDNSTNYGLFVDNNDDQEIFHDAIESASENFNKNHIVSQKDHDESEVNHNDSEEKDHLVDKLIKKFNQKIAKCHKRIEKANQQSKDLENQNKDLQDKYDVLKNQVNTFEEKNNEFNEQIKVLNENNDDLLAQTEVLQEQLKVKHIVIDTHTESQTQYVKLEEERYQYMIRYSALCDNDKQHRKKIDEQEILFDKMSRQLVEMNNNVLRLQEKILEKTNENFRFRRVYEVVSLLEKEKENLEIIESLKSKGFESSENAISESENQSENDCQVVDKICDNLENSKVIAPGMFKINVSQSVSSISVSKTSSDSNNVENKPKRKRRKRTSSKQNDKQVNNDVLRANRNFVHFLDLDTLSSVRLPMQKGVIWKKKESSNTSSVDLSSVSNSNLNKDVKRYSRKDLLSCNNSHHVDTRSAYACNDAMNVSCNSRLYASYDVNDLFVFDDVSIRNSRVSKMPFRKKPRDSLNVHSKSNSNNSLPRTLFRWLPKMQPLAEPVAKWIPKIVQICLWIIDSGCSKHMTGNRALLTFWKVAWNGSLWAIMIFEFCDKGLEVAFRKSTCFVRNEDGVDLLTGDRSSNLYTIALNKIVSNSSACLLAKASSSQSWLWHHNATAKWCRGKEESNLSRSCKNYAYICKLTIVSLDEALQQLALHRSVSIIYITCYLLNDYDDVGKLKAKGDIKVFVFPEVSDSFYEEFLPSSLNDDVQQSSEEVMVSPTNTQSISNNMVPNVNEASSSHNVFDERLEDAYFDAMNLEYVAGFRLLCSSFVEVYSVDLIMASSSTNVPIYL
ncbi:integrase, catalytic region, zinc finger, CCHC-type containing protein [Tanacetum coccineum]